MNKLLVVLCGILMGYTVYSKAGFTVVVTEAVFDGIIRDRLAVDRYVVVVEENTFTPQYLVYTDGFYCRFRRSGRKIFADPRIKVVPAEAVINDQREPL